MQSFINFSLIYVQINHLNWIELNCLEAILIVFLMKRTLKTIEADNSQIKINQSQSEIYQSFKIFTKYVFRFLYKL